MAGTIKPSEMPDSPSVPYGYQDPDQMLRDEAYRRQRETLAGGPLAGEGYDKWFEEQWADPAFRKRWADYAGWTESSWDTARAAYDARQRALAMDVGATPEMDASRQRYLETRAQQAGLLGGMESAARMGGTSAAQWASRAGMNQLMDQVAAGAARDPRLGMRAIAGGGQALANQSMVAQGQEGQARRGQLLGQLQAIRGGDLAQAGREQQTLADDIAWQAAKEQAGQRWADVALNQRKMETGVEGAIRAAQAGNEGGISWQDLSSGILGGLSAGMGAYASMNPSGGGGGVGGGGNAGGAYGGAYSPYTSNWPSWK